VQLAGDELNISIPEFTVAGMPQGLFFAHQWYIATNDLVEAGKLRALIDEKLKALNDDYAVERSSALKEVHLKVLPEEIFSKFMHLRGKVGGQHKFPRVLKGKILQEWQEFLRLENF